MPQSILFTKVANALVEDAVLAVDGGGPINRGIERGAGRVRSKDGGLWVGGRVTLTGEHLAFQPNGMNRAIQMGTLDVTIPLNEVRSVELSPGVLTKIVVVATAETILKVRCFGAAKLADAIRKAAPSLA